MNLKKTCVFLGMFGLLSGVFMTLGMQSSGMGIVSGANTIYIGGNDGPMREQAFISASSMDNAEIIDDILASRLAELSNEGTFLQVYKPSLQATYYALSILSEIGKLSTINQTTVKNYIMSFYDDMTGIFMDEQALRYLDMGTSKYYPLTSFLEANSYATLALEILGQRSEINEAQMISFMWSCQSPITGGFLGQPYSVVQVHPFNFSTLDNTYYAVKTLNLLLGAGWPGFTARRSEVVDFIGDLQMDKYNPEEWWYGPVSWWHGGFVNEKDVLTDSIGGNLWEITQFSSYHALATLEAFGLESTCNLTAFRTYVDQLYFPATDYFQVDPINGDEFNIPATIAGLRNAEISNFATMDESAVVNYLLSNKNAMGIWDASTQDAFVEITNTYEVVRGLSESGNINQLSSSDKTRIAETLQAFLAPNGGFALFPNNYTSLALVHSTIASFEEHDRIADLDLNALYDLIESSYSGAGFEKFFSLVTVDVSDLAMRGSPVEQDFITKNVLTDEVERGATHEDLFKGLDSLKKIFKLDDFEGVHGLGGIIGNVISSQFLESGMEYSDGFGAFNPSHAFSTKSPEERNKTIYLKYSYYAIKIMELLCEYLGLGNITDLSFDKTALASHVQKHWQGGHYEPMHSDNVDDIIENTYYAVYILKAIGMYDKTLESIESFIIQNINYTRIKNVYYCYKISSLLGSQVELDFTLTQPLVNDLYLETIKEFFLTSEKETLDNGVFYWVCDMAKNDRVRILPQQESEVSLGASTVLTASLMNLVLDQFGPYTTVKFDSPQIGTFDMVELANNSFQKVLMIPVETTNYPVVSGEICVYEGVSMISSLPISFQTSYGLQIARETLISPGKMSITFTASLVSGLGKHPLFDGSAQVKVYIGSELKDTTSFISEDLLDTTAFSVECTFAESGNYTLMVELDDGYDTGFKQIFSISHKEGPGYIPPAIVKTSGAEVMFSMPIIISLVAIPSCVIGISFHSKKKVSRSKMSN